uniref:CD72 molecule n=1 Tax=Ursus americanus TaxID=9643 RepID=A0A452SKC3_URSAM
MAEAITYADLRFVKAPLKKSISSRLGQDPETDEDEELTYENVQVPSVSGGLASSGVGDKAGLQSGQPAASWSSVTSPAAGRLLAGEYEPSPPARAPSGPAGARARGAGPRAGRLLPPRGPRQAARGGPQARAVGVPAGLVLGPAVCGSRTQSEPGLSGPPETLPCLFDPHTHMYHSHRLTQILPPPRLRWSPFTYPRPLSPAEI